jgi:UDP-3-O-[3-hydroxymyristoyl] glucosamine N-acyltransferase
MKFTAQQIAAALNGTIEGNSTIEVNAISKIEEGKPGSISFLANPKYTQYIYSTKASIVIVNEDFSPSEQLNTTLIRVKNAENAFGQLLEMYNQVKLAKTGISPNAFINETATVGTNVYIGEFAVVAENAKIGDNVKIYPQVYVGENVIIGENTTLFAGVKIYSDGVIGKIVLSIQEQ